MVEWRGDRHARLAKRALSRSVGQAHKKQPVGGGGPTHNAPLRGDEPAAGKIDPVDRLGEEALRSEPALGLDPRGRMAWGPGKAGG